MIGIFASLPSMPLHTAGEYVAAAYTVAGLALVIYVGIMARRLIGNQREIRELRKIIEEREARSNDEAEAGTNTSATDSDPKAAEEPVA
jgi:hypothetical protein